MANTRICLFKKHCRPTESRPNIGRKHWFQAGYGIESNDKMTAPTLVLSRHRQKTAEDAETAQSLAATFRTTVLCIPFLYDLPAESPILQRLRSLSEPAYFLVPMAPRAAKSILGHLQIPCADVFETKDSVQMPVGNISGGKTDILEEDTKPCWYPVIDDSKCLGCLECVNFCLFGVYAIGNGDRPFVDQPGACRDGCPACSRVCPGKAIMFPLYEDAAIAGYEQTSTDPLDNLIDLVDQI
jgi:NAD-dependent dihydropyrimidine dehydrogenase PreA subunit